MPVSTRCYVVHARLVLRLLYTWLVCFFCMPTRITCTIIMSCTFFPCNFIFNLMAALSTGVATTSSTLSGVEQLRVWDTEEQRQCRCEADWEQKCQKWAATRNAYWTGNRLRMAARRAVEWIGRPSCSFRFEISDLLHTCIVMYYDCMFGLSSCTHIYV